jgi:hypothetical protein
MPCIRYVPVPKSDTEMIEEVTYCWRTTRGMKIMQERTPMEHPLQEAAGQTSHSRSRVKAQVQPLPTGQSQVLGRIGEGSRSWGKKHANVRDAEEPLLEQDDTSYPDIHEEYDEEGDGFPLPGTEYAQPQAQVCG